MSHGKSWGGGGKKSAKNVSRIIWMATNFKIYTTLRFYLNLGVTIQLRPKPSLWLIASFWKSSINNPNFFSPWLTIQQKFERKNRTELKQFEATKQFYRSLLFVCLTLIHRSLVKFLSRGNISQHGEAQTAMNYLLKIILTYPGDVYKWRHS